MDNLTRMMEAIATADRDDVLPDVVGIDLDDRFRLAGELYRRGWATPQTFIGTKASSGEFVRLTDAGQAELQRRLDVQDDDLPHEELGVAQRVKLRVEYMDELYKGTNGDLRRAVLSGEIGERLGWTDAVTRTIAKDVQGEGLVVFRGTGPIVSLTPAGKSSAEARALQPAPPATGAGGASEDRELMTRAVELARGCVGESSKASPRVAAIVVKDGEVLGEAFRGELGPGEHAEFTLLERMLPEATLAGATLYTTLEPCTSRNPPKIPCVERIIERRIKRVVIGMIDPNDAIRGRGELRLRAAGIEVKRFDPDLMTEVEEMNRDFIREQTGPGSVERNAAQVADPVPEEVGPDGHRIGYTEAGDKVEWVPDPDGSGEVPILLRRNDTDLLAAYNEAWDKVWWNRHQILKVEVEGGEPLSPARAEAFAAGEDAAAKLEEKYRRANLECDDFELGLLNGRLSALAWVLGAEWDDSLDT